MNRVIKRYENRKLYDTENRRYVSLEDIGEMVRNGVDVQVVDMATEKDITTQTLTQVILEDGKKGRNPLSKETLHQLLRWSSNLLDDGIEQVRHGIENLVPESVNRIFDTGQLSEIDKLKEKIGSLEDLIKDLESHEIFDADD